MRPIREKPGMDLQSDNRRLMIVASAPPKAVPGQIYRPRIFRSQLRNSIFDLIVNYLPPARNRNGTIPPANYRERLETFEAELFNDSLPSDIASLFKTYYLENIDDFKSWASQ